MSWQVLLQAFKLWSRVQCFLAVFPLTGIHCYLFLIGEVSWLCLRWPGLMQGRNFPVLYIRVCFLWLCQFWILVIFLLLQRNNYNSLSCPFSQGVLYPKIMSLLLNSFSSRCGMYFAQCVHAFLAFLFSVLCFLWWSGVCVTTGLPCLSPFKLGLLTVF